MKYIRPARALSAALASLLLLTPAASSLPGYSPTVTVMVDTDGTDAASLLSHLTGAELLNEYSIIDNLKYTDRSVEDEMIEEQVYGDLRKMIDLLPDEQKEVLNMRMYADMSFKEIADATNVSINTALGRMRYALINLRKMAKDYNLTLALNNF